jgi:rhamnosyltransferase
LCTYNGEKYIVEQVKSILSQKDIEITLLVYDDNSNDKTIPLIRQLFDPRVSINVNKFNSGSPALNFVNSIKDLDEEYLIRFDYFSLSDQDDIWLENKTIEGINLIKENNGRLYASNLTIWDNKAQTKKILKKDFKQTKYDYFFEGASAGCTYIISTDLIVNFKKDIAKIDFSSWKYLSHDWLLYFYARYKNENVIIDSNSYILYRIHDSNVHGTMNLISINAFKSKIKLFYSGWYNINALNFCKYLLHPTDKAYFIFTQFNTNWFSRNSIILKYNFQLFRSKRKFIIFCFFNIFYFKKV